MNRIPTPNMASSLAAQWLRETLQTEMERQHVTKKDLARVAHVERKTIYRWMEGTYSPKLENIAKIFAALGYDSVTIPLKEKENDS